MKELDPFYVVKYAHLKTGKVEHHLFVYNGENFVKELEADTYLDAGEFQIFYEKGKQHCKVYLSDPEFGRFEFVCCADQFEVFGKHLVFKYKQDKEVSPQLGEAVSTGEDVWFLRSSYDPVIHRIGKPYGNERYHCFRNEQSCALRFFSKGCYLIFAEKIRLIGDVPYYRSGNQWWKLDIGSPDKDSKLLPVVKVEVDKLPE